MVAVPASVDVAGHMTSLKAEELAIAKLLLEHGAGRSIADEYIVCESGGTLGL